jgi:uncharacterized protein with PQ loop repeat
MYYLSPMFNEFYECINTVPLTPHFICFSNFSGSCYLFYEIFFCYYTMCCVTKSQIIAFPCSIIMMYPVEYHYAVYAKFIVFSASTNLLHLCDRSVLCPLSFSPATSDLTSNDTTNHILLHH